MSAASHSTCSTLASHSSTRRKARTAPARSKTYRWCEGSHWCIAASNMLTAQRAMHSCSSWKSSVAKSADSSVSPMPRSSTACERRKFHRHCGIESFAVISICTRARTRSSPVICDSCLHDHSPTILGHAARGMPGLSCSASGPSISATHSAYVSRVPGLDVSAVLLPMSCRSASRSQSCRRSRYSFITSRYAPSLASSSRNS